MSEMRLKRTMGEGSEKMAREEMREKIAGSGSTLKGGGLDQHKALHPLPQQIPQAEGPSADFTLVDMTTNVGS